MYNDLETLEYDFSDGTGDPAKPETQNSYDYAIDMVDAAVSEFCLTPNMSTLKRLRAAKKRAAAKCAEFCETLQLAGGEN